MIHNEDGYQPYGESWEDMHTDHNNNCVPLYRELCEELGLVHKEELTLRDVCMYLQLLKEEKCKNNGKQ